MSKSSSCLLTHAGGVEETVEPRSKFPKNEFHASFDHAFHASMPSTDAAVRLIEHFQDLMIRPHSQRLQVLELLNDLMLRHRAALKSLGNEATLGIADLVSGEKDPRSLMIIFSVLHAVMVEWDIAGQAEVCE